MQLNKTSNSNKLKYSEFLSPQSLRNDMLNSLPNKFWSNPNLKILEPSCGKGGFIIDIINKLSENLNIKNKYKHIVEKMLVFGDINKKNVDICRKKLGNYSLKYFVGDALEENLSNFDLVVGNPPYSPMGKKETGNTIYQLFIKKALENWIKNGGYLLFVTPPAWRKPVGDKSKNIGMYDLMTKQNWMKYLEIHNAKDGKKLFDATTRYDWYLIKKTKPKITIIKDELGITNKINLKNWPWIPNYDFKLIKSLLARNTDKTIDVLFSTKYDSDKNIMSKTKSKKFKYVCIHSTPQKGITYFYTSKKIDKKQPKVIFGNSGIGKAFVNKSGKYCLTEHAIGIIDKEKNLDKILKILKSDKMKRILKACLWSNFQIDWRLFTYFKKDFYKKV